VGDLRVGDNPQRWTTKKTKNTKKE
jgi:hypothetical protein